MTLIIKLTKFFHKKKNYFLSKKYDWENEFSYFNKNFLSKKIDVNTCAIVAFKDLNKNRRISKIIEQIQEKYDFYIDVYCLKKPSNIEFFNKINYIEYD